MQKITGDQWFWGGGGGLVGPKVMALFVFECREGHRWRQPKDVLGNS
jgi:hypothetical protein